MIVTPSTAEVQQFYQHMATQFGVVQVDKHDSQTMQLIAGALQLMGIVDAETFMAQFTTTLGHHMYTPFTPGIATPTWDLWAQIEVCVHECQHIHQYEAAGAPQFAWDYLTSHVARAQYEAEAYTCDLEMQWWHYRRLPNHAALARLLSSYGCDATDIAVVTQELGLAAVTVQAGGILRAATQAALTWLNQHAPQLAA